MFNAAHLRLTRVLCALQERTGDGKLKQDPVRWIGSEERAESVDEPAGTHLGVTVHRLDESGAPWGHALSAPPSRDHHASPAHDQRAADKRRHRPLGPGFDTDS